MSDVSGRYGCLSARSRVVMSYVTAHVARPGTDRGSSITAMKSKLGSRFWVASSNFHEVSRALMESHE